MGPRSSSRHWIKPQPTNHLLAYEPTTAVPNDNDFFIAGVRAALLLVITTTFSDLLPEDPERFLNHLQTQLLDQRDPFELWSEYAERQLKGDAFCWIKQYQNLQLDWLEFIDHFQYQYNHPQTTAKLWAEFCGRAQGSNEPLEIFLLGQTKLNHWLAPGSETVFLPLLLEKLRPQIRLLLLAAAIQDLNDLLY